MTTRALYTAEKTQLRTEGQKSLLHLGIYIPEIIFAARVNQAFTTHDQVAELIYDTVTTGAYTDIINGMTVWIGSAAGLQDIGKARIRKTPTSTVLYIGEESEIDFADNLYISVVDSLEIWAKHIRVASGVIYVDYDLPYTDEHKNYNPVPVLGAPFTPLWLDGGTVGFSPNAGESWVIDSSISSFSWATSGGTVANETSDTPTFTFTTAGQYTISCTVTAANGKVTTGYRKVKVFDDSHPPLTAMKLNSCVGSRDGWQFSVEVFADATETEIPSGAMCVLFSRDFFGNTESNPPAALAANENIIATGWIDGETINWSAEYGTVSFKVLSANAWLDKIPSFPTGFMNSLDDPKTWVELEDLTPQKAAFHLLHYRSTATAILDVHAAESEKEASALDAGVGSLWEQLKAMLFETVLISPKCDRYSAIYLQVDLIFMPETNRSAVPVVLDIEKQDWQGSIQLPRKITDATSRLELSGIESNELEAIPYFSRASGNVFKRYGDVTTLDRLLLDSQVEANLLAGLILENDNNEFPNVRVKMAGNLRMSDIAPVQYNTLTIDAGDTVRGVMWVEKRIIPRRITISHDPKTGVLTTDIDHEAETLEGLAVTYERPQTPLNNLPLLPDITDFPDIGDIGGDIGLIDLPDWIPDLPADLPETCLLEAEENGGYDLHISGTQKSNNELDNKIGVLECYLRGVGFTNKTYVRVEADWLKWSTVNNDYVDAGDSGWYNVYALGENGLIVETAAKVTIDPYDPEVRYFTFETMPYGTKIVAIKIILQLDTYGWNIPNSEFTIGSNGTITEETIVEYGESSWLGLAKADVDTDNNSWSYLAFIAYAKFASIQPSGYYDIYYQLTQEQPNSFDDSYLKIRPTGGTGGNSIYIGINSVDDMTGLLEGRFLYQNNMDGLSAEWRHRYGYKLTFVDHAQMLIRFAPVAEHKIVYRKVEIFNICDKDSINE